jgi:hypothetical protein
MRRWTYPIGLDRPGRSGTNPATVSLLDHHLDGLTVIDCTVAVGHTVDVRNAIEHQACHHEGVRLQESIVTAVTVAVLCAVLPRHACSQERQPPDFRVQIWGDISADFSMRIRSYADLRSELERGLPPLAVTADTAAILQRTRALAKKMRAARAHARPGDILTRDAGEKFREALALQVQLDAATCAALYDDNPGSISVPINDRYPTHEPLSTMPANVLAVLPPLPEDIEYRFAGRQLLLFDTRAGIVVDRMTDAIVCRKSARSRSPTMRPLSI